MTSGLKVSALDIGYGDLVVARNLTFDIGPGEVAVLLGPNGVGKTTTLLTIAGAIPALAGHVEIADEHLTGRMDQRARNGIAFIAEDHGVIRGLTVMENLRLSMGERERALDLFPELRAHLNRRAGLLSGGQQKMLSLALHLAGRPMVILADELSLGLAPQLVRRLLKAIRDAADTGISVLLVEQHARQALTVADHGLFLANGAIQARGTGEEMRHHISHVDQSGYFPPNQR